MTMTALTTDENDQEELEEHEYEPTFDSSAGRPSNEQDKAVMAYVLQLIQQRERLILLTIQAKQDQCDKLQQDKKTATKSLEKCDRRQENYEQQLEQLEALLDPADGEQPSNDEEEESVPTARSSRASARALKEKLEETATQMTTSKLQVQTAQDALKITTRDMGLMKNKLLDNKSIEASLIEHAAKLHRWHLQPKIERSTVLKAANEYTKEKNYVPFDEFKKMPKVQRALLWHAAQATLYNLLVQFATANFKYIYNKKKIRQNGKALFDELKKLAVPDTQASKNKARLMIENFRMKKNETYEAAAYRLEHAIKDYTKMGDDCNIEPSRLQMIMTDPTKVNSIYHEQARVHCHAERSEEASEHQGHPHAHECHRRHTAHQEEHPQAAPTPTQQQQR